MYRLSSISDGFCAICKSIDEQIDEPNKRRSLRHKRRIRSELLVKSKMENLKI